MAEAGDADEMDKTEYKPAKKSKRAHLKDWENIVTKIDTVELQGKHLFAYFLT